MDGKRDWRADSASRVALWWIRRDLRLGDNQALAAALSCAGQVVPVFVLDPALLTSPYTGEKRVAFLLAGLRQLDSDLRARGSRLIIRSGQPAGALAQLVRDCGATGVYAEADYSPYARQRDRAVSEQVPLHLVNGLTVHPPQAVFKKDGSPYTVFTPFRRKWSELPSPFPRAVLPAPGTITGPVDLASDGLPPVPESAVAFRPGEQEAVRWLRRFVKGDDALIYRYADQRDRLAVVGTSQLSPYLRFGMLSARQAFIGATAAIAGAPDTETRSSVESWLGELVWREFYISILYHFPAVRTASFRRDLRDIVWSDDRSAFQAWCEGQTGYPVIDAAMRQLSVTGWMPNRARMIVASFLVKDLLVDWRWGEKWFMQHLVDGDPAANNGGWQWSAGTGTDAAPYFRIFNPTTQGKLHDPDGSYVRRWVPELAHVPRERIHEPWRMDAASQRRAGCMIGRDYPTPIVNHAQARDRTLEAYAVARSSSS